LVAEAGEQLDGCGLVRPEPEVPDDFLATPVGVPASPSKVLLEIPSLLLNHGPRWLRRAKNRRVLWEWFRNSGVLSVADPKTPELQPGCGRYFVAFSTWNGTVDAFDARLSEVLGTTPGYRRVPGYDQLCVWTLTQSGQRAAEVFLSKPRGIVVVQGLPSAAQSAYQACREAVRCSPNPTNEGSPRCNAGKRRGGRCEA